jgi:RimJ/RimL family protein N-acetyltransferase
VPEISAMRELLTARLHLRQWRAGDLAPLAALNADPEVMRFQPAVLSRAESDALAAREQAHLERRGFALWALERRTDGAFLGFTGLAVPAFEAPFTPCVELGWRLARAYWGCGFATEAARACLELAFGELSLQEVLAFTVPQNLRSRAVMQRLGMQHDALGDFEHPRLPQGHALRPHVLYRLARPTA